MIIRFTKQDLKDKDIKESNINLSSFTHKTNFKTFQLAYLIYVVLGKDRNKILYDRYTNKYDMVDIELNNHINTYYN